MSHSGTWPGPRCAVPAHHLARLSTRLASERAHRVRAGRVPLPAGPAAGSSDLRSPPLPLLGQAAEYPARVRQRSGVSSSVLYWIPNKQAPDPFMDGHHGGGDHGEIVLCEVSSGAHLGARPRLGLWRSSSCHLAVRWSEWSHFQRGSRGHNSAIVFGKQ